MHLGTQGMAKGFIISVPGCGTSRSSRSEAGTSQPKT